MYNITIYTDGSWHQKQQMGGWACLLVCWPYWTIVSGHEPMTTISRMELTAVLQSLQRVMVPSNITIVSDSKYVVNCINTWILKWSTHKWRKSDGKVVENLDLIFPIFNAMNVHNIKAVWVPSHTGRRGVKYLGNNCVDWFAQHDYQLSQSFAL